MTPAGLATITLSLLSTFALLGADRHGPPGSAGGMSAQDPGLEARPYLADLLPSAGLMARTRYTFDPDTTAAQLARSSLFLDPSLQLDQTVGVEGSGSHTQILGREGARILRRQRQGATVQEEGGELDATGREFLRARAGLYLLLFRFPVLGPTWELRGGTTTNGLREFEAQRGTLRWTLRCDAESGLVRELSESAFGLRIEGIEWGPAPPGSWPSGVRVPLRWNWTPVENLQGAAREDLDELQFDVLCPPDFLAAHGPSEEGERMRFEPAHTERAVQRWSLELREDLAPQDEGHPFSPAGFAALLAGLEPSGEPLGDLATRELHGPVLAWDPTNGRWLRLASARPDTGRGAYLLSGAQGLGLEIQDPLRIADLLGPSLGGPGPGLVLLAPHESPGPQGTRFLSLRLGTLR